MCTAAAAMQAWGVVEYMDSVLGRLFSFLEATGLDRSTYVTLSSDNGEALFHTESRAVGLRFVLLLFVNFQRNLTSTIMMIWQSVIAAIVITTSQESAYNISQNHSLATTSLHCFAAAAAAAALYLHYCCLADAHAQRHAGLAKHTTAEGTAYNISQTQQHPYSAFSATLLLLLLVFAATFALDFLQPFLLGCFLRLSCLCTPCNHSFPSAFAAAAVLYLLQKRMPSGVQGTKHTTAEGGIRSFLAVQGPGVASGGNVCIQYMGAHAVAFEMSVA
jgi:arylsulfatase A-like enzyme